MSGFVHFIVCIFIKTILKTFIFYYVYIQSYVQKWDFNKLPVRQPTLWLKRYNNNHCEMPNLSNENSYIPFGHVIMHKSLWQYCKIKWLVFDKLNVWPNSNHFLLTDTECTHVLCIMLFSFINKFYKRYNML